tara:strand:+ start:1544 stop:2395 length:852 start_codon:yes stop_codon:yes gene_type:complete
MPKVFRTVASVVVSPVVMTKSWFAESGSSFPQYLRNRKELLDELALMRTELAATGGERHTIKTLAQENEELRSLLGYEGEERILAGVIGRPGNIPYDSLMIDQGVSDGVREGAPVYIGDGTVIGIVKNAAPQTALVELITTPGFEATVFIMGPDIYTNAVGVGGGQLRVGVPQGIELAVGDMVVLPSITSGIYGEVSVVQSEPTRPEQYGFVSPHTPLSGIRFVSVGTTPMQSVSFEEAQQILGEIRSEFFMVPVPEDILIDTESGSSTATSSLEVSEESVDI